MKPAPLAFLAFAALCAADDPAGVPDGAEMSWLSNAEVTVGVDLNRGGAIAFLERGRGGNLINNFDFGRQVQLSFFSGPVPFSAGDKHPAKHWEHLGWNPVQAGDDFKHASRILDHRNEGNSIHVKCAPMQWPLDGVAADCTFESWIELDGAVVKVRARLNNARTDKTQYPARPQELPALYANAAFHRVVSYTGDRPFTGGAVAEVPKAAGPHPWSFWQATEGWSALLDDSDRGVGLISPGRVQFTGGFAGAPGPNDTNGNSTGYLASQADEILDHDIRYEFRCELVPGTLAEIRARAAAVRPAALPAWTFTNQRHGWHYRNARDKGWPIDGALDVPLDQPDPQLIGPLTFWRAEDAPFLIIDAAFKTTHRTATIFWQRHGETAPDSIEFPIHPDGEFHRCVVKLADAPGYRGGIVRLRFDPTPGGAPGDWVKVRSVELAANGG